MKKRYLIAIIYILKFFILSAQYPSFGNYQSITIYTPNETPLEAGEIVSDDMSEEDKNSYRTYYENFYGNSIEILEEATYNYNCHGYAWYLSELESNGNKIWLLQNLGEYPIQTPNLAKFWEDDSYILVNAEEEATKLFNIRGDHSAITTSEPGYLISKWGPGPLVLHSYYDCPLIYYLHDTSFNKYYFKCDIENIVSIDYTADKTERACEIIIEDVNIYNNCNIVFKAYQSIEINGPFEIELGSTVEFK